MNYIILDDDLIWKDVINEVFTSEFMQEVEIDGEQRVDCIFGDITGELQPSEHTDGRGRDRIPIIKGFLETGGLKFALLTINEDLLYQESDTFRKKLLGILGESNYWFEIRGTCLQAFGLDTTQFQYFILIHNNTVKNPFVFNFDKGLTFKKTLNNDEEDINNYDLLKLLLEKIKERLF
jgi:hypothetical protein